MKAIHPCITQSVYASHVREALEDNHTVSGISTVLSYAIIKNQLWSVREIRDLTGVASRYIQLDRFILTTPKTHGGSFHLVHKIFHEDDELQHIWCPERLLRQCTHIHSESWRNQVSNYHDQIEHLINEVDPIKVSSEFSKRGVFSIHPLQHVIDGNRSYVIGASNGALYKVPSSHLVH